MKIEQVNVSACKAAMKPNTSKYNYKKFVIFKVDVYVSTPFFFLFTLHVYLKRFLLENVAVKTVQQPVFSLIGTVCLHFLFFHSSSYLSMTQGTNATTEPLLQRQRSLVPYAMGSSQFL